MPESNIYDLNQQCLLWIPQIVNNFRKQSFFTGSCIMRNLISALDVLTEKLEILHETDFISNFTGTRKQRLYLIVRYIRM